MSRKKDQRMRSKLGEWGGIPALTERCPYCHTLFGDIASYHACPKGPDKPKESRCN